MDIFCLTKVLSLKRGQGREARARTSRARAEGGEEDGYCSAGRATTAPTATTAVAPNAADTVTKDGPRAEGWRRLDSTVQRQCGSPGSAAGATAATTEAAAAAAQPWRPPQLSGYCRQ